MFAQKHIGKHFYFRFSTRNQNSWFHQLQQVASVLTQQSSSRHYHTNTRSHVYCSEGPCLVLVQIYCTPCKRTSVVSTFHRIFSQKSWENSLTFLGKCGMDVCVSCCSAVCFILELSHWWLFVTCKILILCDILDQHLIHSWCALCFWIFYFLFFPCVAKVHHCGLLVSQNLTNGFVALLSLVVVRHF